MLTSSLSDQRQRLATVEATRAKARGGVVPREVRAIRSRAHHHLHRARQRVDFRDGRVVALGLVNRDGRDTFPGRTLTPDQAKELAAGVALVAALARARDGRCCRTRPWRADARRRAPRRLGGGNANREETLCRGR